jgi:hypothetical protein
MEVARLAEILEVPVRLLGQSLNSSGYQDVNGIDDDIADDLIRLYNHYLSQLIEPIMSDSISLSFKKMPVIYFLYDGGFVTYVGQSFNVLNRLGQHESCKEYDGICIIQVDSKDIDILELFYINKYNPRDNKTGKERIEIIQRLVKKI